MKGHALEINMIRWECKCKKHSPSGMCLNPKSHTQTVESWYYNGSFFYGLKTQREREKKIKEIVDIANK